MAERYEDFVVSLNAADGKANWFKTLNFVQTGAHDGNGGLVYSASVKKDPESSNVPEIGLIDAAGDFGWRTQTGEVGGVAKTGTGFLFMQQGRETSLRPVTNTGALQSETWASTVVTPTYQRADDITGDGNGRFMVVADFFDELEAQDGRVTGRDDAIAVLAFDADGNLTNSEAYSSDSQESISGAAAVGDKVVIAGRIRSRLTLGDASVSSASGFEAFIALTDYEGNVHWAVDRGQDADDAFNDVAVSPDGNTIYAAGTYGDRVVNFNVPHVAVASYALDGTLNWSLEVEGLNRASANTVAANNDGVYAVGEFNGGSMFDGDQVESDETTFIVVHSSADRNTSWVVLGADAGTGHAIAVDDAGNSVVTATINADQNFCGTDLVRGNHIIFGLDAQGACQWIQAYTALEITRFERSAIGELWGVGSINDDQTLGPDALTVDTGPDALVVRVNPADGTIERAWAFGGPLTDRATGVHIDGQGGVLVSGTFGGSATIGVGDETRQMTGDNADGFVVRITE